MRWNRIPLHLGLGGWLTLACGGGGTPETTVIDPDAPRASLKASSTNPPYGDPTITLTPTFANGVGKVGTASGGSDVSSKPSSDAPIAIPPVTQVVNYFLTVIGAGGKTATASLTIAPQTVTVAPISASANTLTAGASISLSAATLGAYDTSLNWIGPDGSSFSPGTTMGAASTTWTAPASGLLGKCALEAASTAVPSSKARLEITVVRVPLIEFAASQSTIDEGESVALVWNTTAATSVEITSSDGPTFTALATSGQLTVTPTSSLTHYTLTAKNAADDALGTAFSKVTVAWAPPAPALTLTPHTATKMCFGTGGGDGTVYTLDVQGTWKSAVLVSPDQHIWNLGASTDASTLIQSIEVAMTNCALGQVAFCTKALGTWTLTATNGSQTVTKTLDVAVIGNGTRDGNCGY